MYAVVKTGGKQYKVRPGQMVRVEKLEGAVGDTVALNEVLLVGGGEALQIGRPQVEGASVSFTLKFASAIFRLNQRTRRMTNVT